jgi:CTP:molybdopterin cytidylyltransferase MocA
VGDDHQLIEEKIGLSQLTRVVINPDPSRGPLSSLLEALAVVPGAGAVIVHPVDHPLVSSSTLKQLADEHLRLPSCFLLPRYEGQGGHPFLIPKKFFGELRTAPLDRGVRSVLQKYRYNTYHLCVEDPGIVRNINTRADYQELFGYPKLDRNSS